MAPPRWQQNGTLWRLEAPQASAHSPRGLIEFIGGSYLAASPQLSYRRLLEALGAAGWSVWAWSYVPGFDHQSQANEAWRAFRAARATMNVGGAVLRLGHSLGCKLQLLAPDGGRGCQALVALSFNNFSADRSVPLLSQLGQQLGFRSEFSPSPAQTLSQVARSYGQPHNLLVRFERDNLDQSHRLLGVLQNRRNDNSSMLVLDGDHLTPVSGGWRSQMIGSWPGDASRSQQIRDLAATITHWALAVPQQA